MIDFEALRNQTTAVSYIIGDFLADMSLRIVGLLEDVLEALEDD